MQFLDNHSRVLYYYQVIWQLIEIEAIERQEQNSIIVRSTGEKRMKMKHGALK